MILGLSGGVDSTVASVLLHKASVTGFTAFSWTTVFCVKTEFRSSLAQGVRAYGLKCERVRRLQIYFDALKDLLTLSKSVKLSVELLLMYLIEATKKVR